MSHVSLRVNELIKAFPESSVDGKKRTDPVSLRSERRGKEE